MAEIKRLEPYIIIVDQVEIQAYLVVDKHIIDEVPIKDIPFVLMVAFFVYHICYLIRGVITFIHF